MIPKNVTEAYTADNLVQIVDANEFGPKLGSAAAERIIEVARQRTQARGAATEAPEKDFLIATNWDNFCRETFGSSKVGANNVPNRFALGTIDWEVSGGKQAYLVKNAVALQQGWLNSGDERKTKASEIDVTDDGYVDEAGVMWVPKDYTMVVELSDELVREEMDIGDAM